MPTFNKKEFLDKLIAENQEMLDTIQQDFATLSLEKLEQQLAPKKWSIKQCLQHILVTENLYFDQIKKMEGKIPACQKSTFKSSWFGNYFTKTMYPQNNQIKNKMGTAKYMDPIRSMDSTVATDEVLKQIITLKKEVIAFLKDCKSLNIEKNKVQTAIPLLKFKLGDALQFLTAHSLRHILQAKRVLA